MTGLLFKDEVYAIVGAAMRVYNTLGHGFLEGVYQEAFEIECKASDIPISSQVPLEIRYRGQVLKKAYIADLVAHGEIIIELKATGALTSADEAQLLNYLRASGKKVGLLINFGSSKGLEWKRMVF